MTTEPAVILVVDDEPWVRQLLEDALVQFGYKAVSAPSADAALATLRDVVPDLVLTDVNMPGMNGIDLCRRVKTDPRFRFVPVVILTAVSDLDARVAGLSAGADDFFGKPFELVELQARLTSLIRIKRLQDDLEARNDLLHRLLGRYVSEDVAAEILANPGRHLARGGDKCEVTILFADLRGFTALAEKLDPREVVDILNGYLAVGVDAVRGQGGTIDKFTGDGIMALFGAPIRHADDPARAVRAALDIQTRVRELTPDPRIRKRLAIGIGIDTGLVVAGTIGTDARTDYTVIGAAVNAARRLESAAAPGQTLISSRTYDQVKDLVRVRDLGSLRAKGVSGGIRAYDVLGLA